VIYSTFLQRAYDQVVHDVAIQNLPVRFAMDRAGMPPLWELQAQQAPEKATDDEEVGHLVYTLL